MTPSEKILWIHLRKKSIEGFRFLRQHPLFVIYMGKDKFFISDFYCHCVRLVIGLDGPIHQFQKEYDLERAELLELSGYTVLRFKNEEVQHDIEYVLSCIEAKLKNLPKINQ